MYSQGSCIQYMTVAVVLGGASLLLAFVRVLITPSVHAFFGLDESIAPPVMSKFPDFMPTLAYIPPTNLPPPRSNLPLDPTKMLSKNVSIMMKSAKKAKLGINGDVAALVAKTFIVGKAGSLIDSVMDHFFTPESQFELPTDPPSTTTIAAPLLNTEVTEPPTSGANESLNSSGENSGEKPSVVDTVPVTDPAAVVFVESEPLTEPVTVATTRRHTHAVKFGAGRLLRTRPTPPTTTPSTSPSDSDLLAGDPVKMPVKRYLMWW